MALPTVFAGLLAGWSFLVRGPAPWWIVAGLGLYGALGTLAVAWAVRRGEI